MGDPLPSSTLSRFAPQIQAMLSHNPNSLEGGYIGDYIGDYYKGYKGDTRSLDYGLSNKN